MSKRRIVLTGGGTGGHFYPLMAIAESLRRTSGSDIGLYYMGPDRYDAGALQALNITFVKCPAGKQRRYKSFRNILDLFVVCWGSLVALVKLFIVYPDAIMSKGGYTSVPVILAAWFLRIPIVVHESDAVPGKANTLAGRFARNIAISYEESASFFKADKVALTGIPIRTSLLGGPNDQAGAALGLSPEIPSILFLGGSQGAKRINEQILKSLDELLPRFSVIHQTGSEHFDITTASASALITDQNLLSRYHPVPFLDAPTLNEAMHRADLIISRAGSGTIFEIAVHAKPSILIPIPESISHDQRKNAYAYARSGAAIVMEEQNVTESLLVAEINRIMENQALYQEMATAASRFAPRDAAEKITALLTTIAGEHW